MEKVRRRALRGRRSICNAGARRLVREKGRKKIKEWFGSLSLEVGLCDWFYCNCSRKERVVVAGKNAQQKEKEKVLGKSKFRERGLAQEGVGVGVLRGSCFCLLPSGVCLPNRGK